MKEIMQKIFGRMRGFVCMIQTMKLLIRKQIGQRGPNLLYCEAYRCNSCKKILIDYANR